MAYASLYVHFPFCESKCHYCDFYSIGRERTRAGDALRFEAALRREAEQAAPLLAPRIDTIFFGGGTPSMTDPDSMARALEPLGLASRIHDQTEWTMEANPSSIDVDRMRGFRALGVNRVSMGVQAMRDELLHDLGRVHSREGALKALDAVFAAGFTNVSTDLLCGVPGQSLEDLDYAIGELTTRPISHLSCYLLTLPPHHRMYAQLPNEDTQLAHLLHIDRRLQEAGFAHYEISNFAKPGREARHNLRYWQGASYLALGPSAHSFDASTKRRWKNVSSLHLYCQNLETGKSVQEQEETLSPAQLELERWMLGLRLAEGIPAEWLDTPLRRARAQAFGQSGILEIHPANPGRYRLTPKGFALSDQVIQSLA